IKVVESTNGRLVFYIAPGGKTASFLGWFSAVWCAFTGIITATALGGAFQAPANGHFMALPVLGIFWAVGIGMACFWLKMKYERTFLLIERERLVLQRVLFGRKRVDEMLLTPTSRAELVESYQQNDEPVYRIEVQGLQRTAKFGMSLSDEDKDWI